MPHSLQGSALATLAVQSMTRFPISPQHITLFGNGQQAIQHAAFFSSLYREKALHLDFVTRSGLSLAARNELQELGVHSDSISAILSNNRDEVERSVSRADIIICCTPSLQPLFPSSWVQSGTHIVLIGSCGYSAKIHSRG
jgi:ornithine cyclodeaminase/alanine dehydrogenase-like protein (mu-crystallin family)